MKNLYNKGFGSPDQVISLTKRVISLTKREQDVRFRTILEGYISAVEKARDNVQETIEMLEEECLYHHSYQLKENLQKNLNHLVLASKLVLSEKTRWEYTELLETEKMMLSEETDKNLKKESLEKESKVLCLDCQHGHDCDIDGCACKCKRIDCSCNHKICKQDSDSKIESSEETKEHQKQNKESFCNSPVQDKPADRCTVCTRCAKCTGCANCSLDPNLRSCYSGYRESWTTDPPLFRGYIVR